MIAQVNHAAMDNRCIEIAYQPLKDSAATLRSVEPYKIWIYEGTLYIDGRCRLRNEIQTFVPGRTGNLYFKERPQ